MTLGEEDKISHALISSQRGICYTEDEAPEIETTTKTTRFYISIAAIVVALFLVTLDLVILPASLPAIAQDLKATSSQAYWCGTGYIIAQAASQPIFGTISVISGRKLMLQISLLIFMVASIMCARAQSIEWLIGTRVMQGLGGGGITTLTIMVVTDLTSLQERSKWMSILSLSYAFGNVGLVLGAAITEFTTWRWVYYINIPVCVILLAVLQLSLHLQPKIENHHNGLLKFDWAGIAILGGSASTLLLGLLSGGVSHPWSSAAIIAPLVIGVIGLVCFAIVEYFAPMPMFPRELLKSRTFNATSLISFVGGYAVTSLAFFLIVYFHGAAGYGVIHSAVAVLPTIILVPAGGIIGGVIITKSGDYRGPLYFGCAAVTAGMSSLTVLSPLSSVGLQTGLQIPIGIGLGFIYIASNIAPQATLPSHLHAVSVNQITFTRVMGQAFGIAIGGAIFQNQFDNYVNNHVRDGSLSDGFRVRGKDAELAFTRIDQFPQQVSDVYSAIYCDSLRAVWFTGMALSAVALLCCFSTQKASLGRDLTANRRLPSSK
ncbi:hypothetical protein V499_01100 [Pseudogymnoascus sp. VKM F-103]|uniref:Major facilitator superfamily (MFS) profile domain-containing protein n=1 Tax=Pseudogymnoascus verrucosus TaxID=342668 RepID=A0A1B8GKH8_9PEZI|nr:uncharacterized protein VE01_05858 [Pseudogymnoascus verrucosus]KFY79994.1 hypothetical protein V499_01100 [Pseudogymnoascus sp. VKM F-103]OBT96266.1 hypothetical protein VE01_05858 [Pseudogymnoascus verrucosus]